MTRSSVGVENKAMTLVTSQLAWLKQLLVNLKFEEKISNILYMCQLDSITHCH